MFNCHKNLMSVFFCTASNSHLDREKKLSSDCTLERRGWGGVIIGTCHNQVQNTILWKVCTKYNVWPQCTMWSHDIVGEVLNTKTEISTLVVGC